MEEGPKINRSIFREHLFDFYAFFKKWFCFLLEKGTGNKCEDHKPATLFVGSVILYFVTTGVLFNFGSVISLLKVAGTQKEDNLASAASIKIQPPQGSVSEKAKDCNLNNGKWTRWYGKVNQDFEDKNHFILPSNSGGTLFKYNGEIKNFSYCEFVFVPRSENSVNYVISLDDIYQIVIGDNDFWTVSLKSTDKVGGELIPIKENLIQKTRPRLLSKIKNGTTVKVSVTQKFLDNRKYEVVAEVSYKADVKDSEIRNEKFSWIFDPSPAILNSPELSVGLIRSPDDSSEIGVGFVYPNITLNLSN